MAKALPNPTAPVFTLDDALLERGKKASRESPRKRIILPVQRSQEARVQRLLNFLQPGTCVTPHRHPLPHATESLCLLSGHLEVLIFDSVGWVVDRHHLTPASPLLDLEPGIWHTLVVHEPDTVLFEVKQGPYQAETDKEFAPWAPAEDSRDAPAYLAELSRQ